MSVFFFMSACVPHAYPGSTGQERTFAPWNWSYGDLWVNMGVGNQTPRFSARGQLSHLSTKTFFLEFYFSINNTKYIVLCLK